MKQKIKDYEYKYLSDTELKKYLQPSFLKMLKNKSKENNQNEKYNRKAQM